MASSFTLSPSVKSDGCYEGRYQWVIPGDHNKHISTLSPCHSPSYWQHPPYFLPKLIPSFHAWNIHIDRPSENHMCKYLAGLLWRPHSRMVIMRSWMNLVKSSFPARLEKDDMCCCLLFSVFTKAPPVSDQAVIGDWPIEVTRPLLVLSWAFLFFVEWRKGRSKWVRFYVGSRQAFCPLASSLLSRCINLTVCMRCHIAY